MKLNLSEDLFFLENTLILRRKLGVLFAWTANIFDEPKWSSNQKRLDAPALEEVSK